MAVHVAVARPKPGGNSERKRSVQYIMTFEYSPRKERGGSKHERGEEFQPTRPAGKNQRKKAFEGSSLSQDSKPSIKRTQSISEKVKRSGQPHHRLNVNLQEGKSVKKGYSPISSYRRNEKEGYEVTRAKARGTRQKKGKFPHQASKDRDKAQDLVFLVGSGLADLAAYSFDLSHLTFFTEFFLKQGKRMSVKKVRD